MGIQRTTFVLAWVIGLILLSPRVDGQSDQKAVLVEQFGVTSSELIRARFDIFFAELTNNPGSKGLVYSHGTESQITGRSRYFQDQLRFRGFDPTRITFVRGRNIGSVRTDMWLVPAGAAPPEIKPEGFIAVEIGSANKLRVVEAYESFFSEVNRQPDNYVSYIINYGSPAQIAARERWFQEPLRKAFGYHPPRMTFVNGGRGSVRTVMWVLPPGAE